MLWSELLANWGIALIAFLLLDGAIKISLGLLIFGLALWVVEVQFLLQIIINRLTIVMTDQKKAFRIKWGVAALMTVINIAVFCIWIPAQLQVSETYMHINKYWDRTSKVIILIVDVILNWYFVKIVKERLVDGGLTKYDALVRFNIRIMLVSIAVDVMIIGLMSLTNPFLYVAFQAPAYLVKLKIEMSMADLIAKVAQSTNNVSGLPLTVIKSMTDTKNHDHDPHTPTTDMDGGRWQRKANDGMVVNTFTDVTVESMEVRKGEDSDEEILTGISREVWVSGGQHNSRAI